MTLFRYPTSLVVALAGGLAYDDPDRIRYDALSIGEAILRPAEAPAQAPGKLNSECASGEFMDCIGSDPSLYCLQFPYYCER